MTVANAAKPQMTVSDPNAEYESLKLLWLRSRAFCSGEAFVKAFDSAIDVVNYRNVLIPFSPSMTQQQYDFYKAEAELPGIVAEFSKMLVGGLLRKQPVFKLPDDAPEGAADWIRSTFNQDNTSLMSFLDAALWEEVQTSRVWVYIDYPVVQNAAELTPEERKDLKPYPVLWAAETVINWNIGKDSTGRNVLKRVITKGLEERFKNEEAFHPEFVEIINVHELDSAGYYQIRKYEVTAPLASVQTVAGQKQPVSQSPKPELKETVTNILKNGDRLKMIPAWPLNGQIEAQPPMLTTIIDKEVGVYNKISRRNHLLYGAATYTPVIAADITDEQFNEIVGSGLGTWLKLPSNGTVTVLETPTAALQDMEKAIASAIEEMAKLGIRMLSPESAQSGVALDIRNAAQTARLGALSNRISSTMCQIIAFMLEWRYGIEVNTDSVSFTLSEDFNPTPLGADWLRLATEWYQQGLIPRSIWLQMLKQNDMVPADYDDDEGQKEIAGDSELVLSRQNEQYANQLKHQEDNSTPVENDANV